MHHDDYNAHNVLRSLRARRLTRNDEWIPHMRLQLDRVHAQRYERRLERVVLVVTIVVIVIAFALVGRMSLQDVRADHATYCDMVARGLWPDYKHIYHTECVVARKR